MQIRAVFLQHLNQKFINFVGHDVLSPLFLRFGWLVSVCNKALEGGLIECIACSVDRIKVLGLDASK